MLVSFRTDVRNLPFNYFLTYYEDSSASPQNDKVKVPQNDKVKAPQNDKVKVPQNDRGKRMEGHDCIRSGKVPGISA